MNKPEPRIIIAVDGFSSCGKSTMAKALARNIGYIYIDSGAMYRAVTLYCLDHGLIDGETVDTDTDEVPHGRHSNRFPPRFRNGYDTHISKRNRRRA